MKVIHCRGSWISVHTVWKDLQNYLTGNCNFFEKHVPESFLCKYYKRLVRRREEPTHLKGIILLKNTHLALSSLFSHKFWKDLFDSLCRLSVSVNNSIWLKDRTVYYVLTWQQRHVHRVVFNRMSFKFVDSKFLIKKCLAQGKQNEEIHQHLSLETCQSVGLRLFWKDWMG